MELRENEIVIIVPSSLATGEPGDPLSPTVAAIIFHMAETRYAPVDFGEDHGNCIELWFMNMKSVKDARKSAAGFVKAGGEVPTGGYSTTRRRK